MKHGPDAGHRMIDAVMAVDLWNARRDQMADSVLEGWGWHPKQADAILEKATLRGYIEYGVSARTAWLTDKGRELLRNTVDAG